jgi:Domain of unknown function (DUF892)
VAGLASGRPAPPDWIKGIMEKPKPAPKPSDLANPVGNSGPLPPIQTKSDPRRTTPPPGFVSSDSEGRSCAVTFKPSSQSLRPCPVASVRRFLRCAADDIAGEVDNTQVMDAPLVAAAQAVEHYEIARYGTLIAWAKLAWSDRLRQCSPAGAE